MIDNSDKIELGQKKMEDKYYTMLEFLYLNFFYLIPLHFPRTNYINVLRQR